LRIDGGGIQGCISAANAATLTRFLGSTTEAQPWMGRAEQGVALPAFDDTADRSTASAGSAGNVSRGRERLAADEWRSRSRELKEEFFALMDQLAEGEISPSDARVETTRINDEMATLIKLTLLKRD
jgi:hypothetical protein